MWIGPFGLPTMKTPAGAQTVRWWGVLAAEAA